MQTTRRPYDDSDSAKRSPVSFNVMVRQPDPEAVQLPLQPSAASARQRRPMPRPWAEPQRVSPSLASPSLASPALVRRSPAPIQQVSAPAHQAVQLAPMPRPTVSPVSPTVASAGLAVGDRPSMHRSRPQVASSPQLVPQLKVTSSVVPAPAPLAMPAPQRGVVKPLPSARVRPQWLVRLRWMQRCSTVVATLLVGATLTAYGATVYSQQRWGGYYESFSQAQQDMTRMGAFMGAIKALSAEQAELPGSPLTGRPTPASTLPLEPEAPRPPLDVPPADEETRQSENGFWGGY